jgi:hypothetical protein
MDLFAKVVVVALVFSLAIGFVFFWSVILSKKRAGEAVRVSLPISAMVFFFSSSYWSFIIAGTLEFSGHKKYYVAGAVSLIIFVVLVIFFTYPKHNKP